MNIIRAIFKGICDSILFLVSLIIRNPKRKTQRAVLFYFFWSIALGAFFFLLALAEPIVGFEVAALLCLPTSIFFMMFVLYSVLYVPITIYGENIDDYLDGLDDEHWPC